MADHPGKLNKTQLQVNKFEPKFANKHYFFLKNANPKKNNNWGDIGCPFCHSSEDKITGKEKYTLLFLH